MGKTHTDFKDEVDLFFSSLPDDAFEKVACPLCATSKYSIPMFKKGTMRLMHCLCGMVYNARQAKQEVLDQFYSKSKAMTMWSNLKSSPEAFESQREKYEWAINHIITNGTRTVLDVGCGDGVFLKLLKLEGTEVSARGIDQNQISVNAAKSQGLDVTCASIHGYKTNEKFDVVTLWGVFEHVKNPLELLWQAKSLLSPNGQIIVCVPNYSSTVFQHLKEKCYSYCPQHLWYFCLDTLEVAFERCNLELERFTTIESEINPIIKHMLGFDAYSEVPLEHLRAHIDECEEKELEGYVLSLHQGYKIIAIGKQRKCTMQ